MVDMYMCTACMSIKISGGRTCTCKYDYHQSIGVVHPCPHVQIPFARTVVVNHRKSLPESIVTPCADIICASDNSIYALSISQCSRASSAGVTGRSPCPEKNEVYHMHVQKSGTLS